jgi:hypothetical protein
MFPIVGATGRSPLRSPQLNIRNYILFREERNRDLIFGQYGFKLVFIDPSQMCGFADRQFLLSIILDGKDQPQLFSQFDIVFVQRDENIVGDLNFDFSRLHCS